MLNTRTAVICCGCGKALRGRAIVITMQGDNYCEDCFREELENWHAEDIADAMGLDVCEAGDFDPPPSEWDLYFGRF